jgi:malonate-semialdehyde dehydrogenase (acetylating)/methylmalonate-semialdehyde dehydrogenase
MKRITHHIGGKLVAGSPAHQPGLRPGDRRGPGRGRPASAAEVDMAVAVAADAFPGWASDAVVPALGDPLPAARAGRRAPLDLAKLLTSEHGKVLSDASGEVARGLENLEFACGIPHLLKGGFSEQASSGVDVYSIRQPLGVVAGITPFNFPAMVPMWMFANAIACGNTFILKPSERDPSASLLIADLLSEAGLPDGVFNVVQGDKEAVDAILEHKGIAAVSFVGSTPVARYVYETGTRNGKRVQALGGAKNHMVLLPDADVDMAADAAVSAAYGSAGERCMAISVVVAVGDVADPFVEAVNSRLDGLKIGPGTDPDSQMGPLITGAHRDRVASYIEAGAQSGATVVADGARPRSTVTGSSRRDAARQRAAGDERLHRRDLRAGAVRASACRRTTTRCGWSTTTRTATARRSSPRRGSGPPVPVRRAGRMVGINVPIPVPVAYYSFGGWKDSLFGDNHMYGPDGIQFYTRTKVVTSRWPDPATSRIDLGFPQNR